MKNRANEQTKRQNTNQRVKSIWERSLKSHLGTIIPVSLANNRASVIWEKLCQDHLVTIIPVILLLLLILIL